MEEATIPPDQQQSQGTGPGGGTGPEPFGVPADRKPSVERGTPFGQAGTAVAEREHAPPDGHGKGGEQDIAGQ